MKGKCKQCGRTVDDIVNNSHNYCDVTHDDSFYSNDFCVGSNPTITFYCYSLS